MPHARSLYVFLTLTLLGWSGPLCSSVWAEAWDQIRQTGELRWGGDPAGGAPYVFSDPHNPSRYIGFELDIMEAVARHLGVRAKFVLTSWDELVPALLRGDFDVAVNGLEITPERAKVIHFSQPYYLFSEQITVRRAGPRLMRLTDLRGHRVGTLAVSLAYQVLIRDPQIQAVPYPSPVEAYHDLQLGRTDAVVMDLPIAAWYAEPNPLLENVGSSVADGLYAVGLRQDSPQLRERINEALTAITQSGELERIYRRWNLWNDRQKELRLPGFSDTSPPAKMSTRIVWNYLPLLLRGAGMTILLSILSMALAVLGGSLLCLGKLYGNRAMRILCDGYIEVIRGTPLLIQLYLLYYGLPNVGIQLNAFTAAILGMGLNYAAYEAEIYRAGLLSIPRGQSDAARSLGMTPGQTLWWILVPQAVRTILPPSTNDFIALFKDTSLVSIITVTELTKVYSTAATSTYRFLELGFMTAALYFAMSYPLSLWSRALERRHHAALH